MLDSTLAAAAILLIVTLFAGRPGTGNYLRFAAILLAALALAALSDIRGLASAAALIVLPLSGAAMGLSALARTRRRAPQLVAACALASALTAGLFALFTGLVTAALLPLALGGAGIAIGAAHQAVAFARHHLAEQLGDEKRRQAGAVPERVMALRLALAHQLHLQARTRARLVLFVIAAFTMHLRGLAAFADRARAGSRGSVAPLDRRSDGRQRIHACVIASPAPRPQLPEF
jgi:hypothetical protein